MQLHCKVIYSILKRVQDTILPKPCPFKSSHSKVGPSAAAWVVRVVCDQNGTLGVAHAASAAAGCVSSPLLTAQLLRRVTNALTEGFSLGLQTVHVQVRENTFVVFQIWSSINVSWHLRRGTMG